MTIQEIRKHYVISEDKLKEYEVNGFLKRETNADGMIEYEQKEVEQLGLVSLLLKAGFTVDMAKAYIEREESSKMRQEQIRMLRICRGKLLDEIHEKQKLLDQIDYMVWNKKREGEK